MSAEEDLKAASPSPESMEKAANSDVTDFLRGARHSDGFQNGVRALALLLDSERAQAREAAGLCGCRFEDLASMCAAHADVFVAMVERRNALEKERDEARALATENAFDEATERQRAERAEADNKGLVALADEEHRRAEAAEARLREVEGYECQEHEGSYCPCISAALARTETPKADEKR